MRPYLCFCIQVGLLYNRFNIFRYTGSISTITPQTSICKHELSTAWHRESRGFPVQPEISACTERECFQSSVTQLLRSPMEVWSWLQPDMVVSCRTADISILLNICVHSSCQFVRILWKTRRKSFRPRYSGPCQWKQCRYLHLSRDV